MFQWKIRIFSRDLGGIGGIREFVALVYTAIYDLRHELAANYLFKILSS